MMTSHFDRASLPPARTFYERELGEFRRPSRGWATPKAGCPFHQSESKTSFRVNLETGGFNCFGCGAKGGDVLAFVRLRYRLSFQDAAKQLGAWCDPSQSDELRQRQIRREREQAEREATREQERAERITARDALQSLERQYSRAGERLAELRSGRPERYRGEQELAWWFLADTLPRIREAERRYCELAGLEITA